MLRRPASRDDVPAITALYCAYELAVRGAPDTDESDILEMLEAPGVDPETDTLVVEDAGRVVGYAEVRPQGECDSVIDLERAGSGLADELLAWLEQRDGTLQHYLADSDAMYRELFERRGWTPARRFWRMRIDFAGALPEPAWPAGVAVRSFDRDRDARVAHDVITTAFREIGGQRERAFDEWCTFFLDTPGYDAELCLVAEEGCEVVGVAMSRDVGDYGFVRQLAVPVAHRGRGIALALLYECFRRHAARGLPATALGVDAANPTGALAVYEKAGMRVHEQFTRWELRRPAAAAG